MLGHKLYTITTPNDSATTPQRHFKQFDTFIADFVTMNIYELRFIILCTVYDLSVLAVEIQNNFSNRIYLPTWKDFDTRPLPQWYDSAKIGIFVHWGVYSVPSFKDEWFQFRWGRGNSLLYNFVIKKYF